MINLTAYFHCPIPAPIQFPILIPDPMHSNGGKQYQDRNRKGMGTEPILETRRKSEPQYESHLESVNVN